MSFPWSIVNIENYEEGCIFLLVAYSIKGWIVSSLETYDTHFETINIIKNEKQTM